MSRRWPLFVTQSNVQKTTRDQVGPPRRRLRLYTLLGKLRLTHRSERSSSTVKLETSKERSSKVAAKNERKVELNEYIFGSKKVLYRVPVSRIMQVIRQRVRNMLFSLFQVAINKHQRLGCSSLNPNWAPFSRREETMEADTTERGARMRMAPRRISPPHFPTNLKFPLHSPTRHANVSRSLSHSLYIPDASRRELIETPRQRTTKSQTMYVCMSFMEIRHK